MRRWSLALLLAVAACGGRSSLRVDGLAARIEPDGADGLRLVVQGEVRGLAARRVDDEIECDGSLEFTLESSADAKSGATEPPPTLRFAGGPAAGLGAAGAERIPFRVEVPWPASASTRPVRLRAVLRDRLRDREARADVDVVPAR